MNLEAWYRYSPEGRWNRAIQSVPIVLTTDHAASSYGLPVLLQGGQCHGPADLPAGSVVLTAEQDLWYGGTVRKAGFAVAVEG